MTAASVKVRLSAHCIERFQARFRPGLDAARAGEELRAMLEHGQISHDPPAWLVDRRRQPDAYLLLGSDVAMPLVRSSSGDQYHAVTCLSRGSISAAERQRRKTRRADDKRHRRRR